MSGPDDSLEMDKALRDRAKSTFLRSLAILRGDAQPAKIAGRAAARAGEGAAGFAEDVSEGVRKNYGKLFVATGAIAVWFARKPIKSQADQLRKKLEEKYGGRASNKGK